MSVSIRLFVSIREYDHSFQVMMDVGVQHFPVGHLWDSRSEAEWYAARLEEALINLVEECKAPKGEQAS